MGYIYIYLCVCGIAQAALEGATLKPANKLRKDETFTPASILARPHPLRGQQVMIKSCPCKLCEAPGETGHHSLGWSKTGRRFGRSLPVGFTANCYRR